MDTTLKVFIRIRWTSRYTQMELQHEYYSARFLHPARRQSTTKACLKAQSSAQLRDICGTTLRARISHKPEKINFHTSTNQQIDKQHGPVMKFLAKWKGARKGAPQAKKWQVYKDLYKGKHGKTFWKLVIFRLIKDGEVLMKSASRRISKAGMLQVAMTTSACKVWKALNHVGHHANPTLWPNSHPYNCDTYDPIWSNDCETDWKCASLSESRSWCLREVATWQFQKIYKDWHSVHRACHLGQFVRAAQGIKVREQKPKIMEPRKQNDATLKQAMHFKYKT